jgi:arsenate reductase-like glutaredoxin family protein
MSKGGARLGAGRKPKEEVLRVANFRLSMEDLKVLDKKGIGKNSSDKLRYILTKFKNEKINMVKRRKAYKLEKFSSFDEAEAIFRELSDKWKQLNKTKFLLGSSLKNDMRMKFEIINRKIIENSDNFDELKKFGWFLQNTDFKWNDTNVSKLDIYLKKDDYLIILPVTSEGSEFVVNYQDNLLEETVDEVGFISLTEEDVLAYFYEDLQELMFKKECSFNAEENRCNKKYSNGDVYKTLEYDNVVVLELDYNDKNQETTLNFIKELIV